MVDFAIAWPTWKFLVECLIKPISYHLQLLFDFVPFLIATRAEKLLLQRYVMANGSNIQKASSDSCGYDLCTEH